MNFFSPLLNLSAFFFFSFFSFCLSSPMSLFDSPSFCLCLWHVFICLSLSPSPSSSPQLSLHSPSISLHSPSLYLSPLSLSLSLSPSPLFLSFLTSFVPFPSPAFSPLSLYPSNLSYISTFNLFIPSLSISPSLLSCSRPFSLLHPHYIPQSSSIKLPTHL